MTRARPTLALALALAGTVLAGPALAQEPSARPDLLARADVGFDGTFVEGTWVPLVVTLELPPRAAPLSGRVVVEPLPTERVAWFAAPFSLPGSPSGSRTRVALGVPAWGDKSFAVRVEDESGRELSVVLPSARGLEHRDRLVLVTRLSGLAAFADPPPRGGTPPQGPILQLVRAGDGPGVELRDRFPDRPELLQGLGAVVLAEAPGVAELVHDAARTSALEAWVRTGGEVIVVGAGAPYWQGTPVEEWLPVVATGAREAPAPGSLGFLGLPFGGGTVAEATLRAGGALLEGTPSRPLVAVRPLGAGRVVFLAFDPDAPELRGLAEATRYLRGLVGPSRSEAFPIPPERLGHLADGVWDEVAPLSVPGLAGIALAALGAAAIAGVGARVRRGRPDRVWVAPVLAALLGGGVVLAASLAREPSHARSLAWVFVEPQGSCLAVENLALVAGDAASFEVDLAPGAHPVALERRHSELVDFRARRAGLTSTPGASPRIGPVDVVPKGVATAQVAARGAIPQAPRARVHVEGTELVVEATGPDPLPAGLAVVIDRGSGRTTVYETPAVPAGGTARVKADQARDLAARLHDEEAQGPLWDRTPERTTHALLLRTLAVLEPRPGPGAPQGPLVCLALPGPPPGLAKPAAGPRGAGTPATPVPVRSAHAVYLFPPSEGP